MPSGYTCDIAEGQSFEEFVWRCARGMGALVMMREQPLSAEIPDKFKPSTLEEEQVRKAEAQLTELNSMGRVEATRRAIEAYNATISRNSEYAAKDVALSQKYQAMIERVMKWQPPSSDHEGFKRFMLEQLQESMRFDCGCYQESLPSQDGEAWLTARKLEAIQNLERARKRLAEEIERTEARNRWIRQLRESVPDPKKMRPVTP